MLAGGEHLVHIEHYWVGIPIKKALARLTLTRTYQWSGWPDSNRRPPAPEAGAQCNKNNILHILPTLNYTHLTKGPRGPGRDVAAGRRKAVGIRHIAVFRQSADFFKLDLVFSN